MSLNEIEPYEQRPVWIIDLKTYGYMISLGAYVSLIRYEEDGVEYELYVENDGWRYLFEYEQE